MAETLQKRPNISDYIGKAKDVGVFGRDFGDGPRVELNSSGRGL